MNPAIEITICGLAWLVTLLRLRPVIDGRVWRTDRIAFRIWIATLFFAFTLTFLVGFVGAAINRLTWPNLARLLAYISVTLTLYLVASAFLVTFPTPANAHQARYLAPYLIFTQLTLLVVYASFVARTAEWVDNPVPATLAEAVFKLTLFTYATILCWVMAAAVSRYLRQEAVTVTRYRLVMIVLTASGGAAFFFTKVLLSLGYFWPMLGARWLYILSMLLEVFTAFLWTLSFLHNNVYAHLLAFLKGLRSWPVYGDLTYLVDSLGTFFNPVGLVVEKPGFWQFVRRSDFYLYRAIVHILDGKAMLSDYLDNDDRQDDLLVGPAPFDVQQARRVNNALQTVPASEDFGELVAGFRAAGQQLQRSTS